MNRRILSLAVTLILVVSTLCMPVSVLAADFSTGSDFEDYTGSWNGVDNFGCVLPIFPNVATTKCSPTTLNEYSGITNGTAADSKYGNSLKIVQKPNTSAAKGDYTMVHFDEEMTGSMYLEVSMYMEKSETGKYSGKAIRMNCDGGLIYPVNFNETQKIDVFGTSTGVTWSPDEWYDVKAWYNLDSGAYKVQIANDGNSVVDTFGLTTAGKKMNRFIFYMVHHCKHDALINAGEQVTYFDNFRLENTDKVIIDEMASLAHYTFDQWGDGTNLPDGLGKGTWYKNGTGDHIATQIETDRGYSMKLSADVKTDDSDTAYAKNCLWYYNYGSKVTTAAAMKVSFMFPDANFASVNINMANSIKILDVVPNGSIYAFEGFDTGMDMMRNTWYDLECIIDYDTGYYTIKLTDGVTEFEKKGFSAQVIALTDAHLYRTWFKLNGRWDDDYTKETALIIDDYYYGAISKLSAPLYGTCEGSASLELPFKNTKFRYKADITLSDLNANRTLVATTASTSVEIAKFGSDGKLYIGGAEAADITAGTYSAEVIFDQANYNATVTISKDGAEVATGTAALGTAKVLLETVDWLVDEEGTLELDNVEYRGIYDFALDNTASSKGTIKASEQIVARFTNAVDKESFNSTTVIVNDGEIIPEISFIDDNTVKFDFAKAPGSAYTVKFTGVSDLFGNTLTDYIRVTMDDEGGIYLTDVEFTKNGEIAEVTTPGTITAKVSAAAYGGDEAVNYTLALYEGGRMVDCSFVNFTATKTLEEHSLDITIPNDGKHYILKAYINDSETLEAYAEPGILKATNKPVIILKLDGIGTATRLTAFEPAYEYAVANNIKMNFGVLARELDSTNTDDVARLDEMENHEMIEFWNHQYGAGNMSEYTRDEIFADFENAKLASEKTGVEYVTFNSIENYVHSDIVDALNAYNYKGVLSRATENRLEGYGYLDRDNTFTTLWRTFDVEVGASGTLEDGSTTSRAYTVCLPVEDMVDDWETAQSQKWPYAVLQYHPVNWPASDLTTSDGKVYSSDYMYDFIEYLEAEGVIFMTTTEYIDYASVLH